MNKLRVLDLFSGIGGFSLGLERTGGFETVAFCEIEEFPRRVLAKHWPNIPCYRDVRELTAERLAADGIRVDVVAGGCRDVLPTLGKVAHIITDPPYSERTHERHDENSQNRRDGADARALGYSALSETAAQELAHVFHDATDGWVVWLTDAELSPCIRRSFDGLKRTTFPPLPYFHSGRSVRLAGDGPCSWTDWIVVARTKALNKWGTLRGGYIASEGWNDKARMGGKPSRLMQLIVSDYSREGELVCDPFMGAGTTGVACMKEGRDFIGIEIDPAAFDIACKRIEQAQRQGDLFIDGAAA